MGRLNLEKTTYFTIDYRSMPSGVGTIFFSNDRTILVTEADCGPSNMSEAKKIIKPEYLPTEVQHIPISMGENWEEGNNALGEILHKNDVQYVIDTELAYEFEDLTENFDQCAFTIHNWCKIRNIKL